MVVNDAACLPTKRSALESIASKLAPTGALVFQLNSMSANGYSVAKSIHPLPCQQSRCLHPGPCRPVLISIRTRCHERHKNHSSH
ncbi:hypothetical protein DOZ80_26045 [Pseudomonas fluorescens]|uniref:Uncharacterized protein n=1 Tax=Pseudomonas fluorescens TaxID=294 RepID=A0A327MNZ9_PSEFL|nr:hypothetical protein DOZ80_26045 [Pseudomonas fluorescens]